MPSELIKGATSVTVYTTTNHGRRRIFQSKTPVEAGGGSSEPTLPANSVVVMNWDAYGITGTHTYTVTLQDTDEYPYFCIQGWRNSNAGASAVGGTFTFN